MGSRVNVRRCTVALAIAWVMAASAPVLAQHPAGHPGGAPPAGHPGGAPPVAAGPHQHVDTRFSHNHPYYDHGFPIHHPPPGGREFHGPDGNRYWYHGGNWYCWRGGAWVVWGPPTSLFVPFLPLYFTTVWWDGVPYYYANDTYYAWVPEQQQYEVVVPPDGIETNGTIQPPGDDQLFVYPKNGQSSDQQSKDEYECHRWAVDQTGYDPTKAGGGVSADQAASKRSDHLRAKTSCLEGRGYSVK